MKSRGIPLSNAELAAQAVCGAYLMVAFSDGEYDKREQVRMLSGLAAEDVPTGVNQAMLLEALPHLEEAFRTDYEKAVGQTLDAVSSVRGTEFARKGIMQAARIAVVANQEITAQEEQALAQIENALGLGNDKL